MANRSKVIVEALVARREREEAGLVAEGYRFYAQETCEFAAVSLQAVSNDVKLPLTNLWSLEC